MTLLGSQDDAVSIELLRRLRSGDATAFEILYRRHRDELLLSVRAGMGPRLRETMQSEDVLQSVAMEAFALLRGAEQPVADFTRLLRRMVRHRLIDRARAIRRGRVASTSATPIEEVPANPPPPTYDDPRFEKLERALLALPHELRDVLRLRRFDGLSSQEAAARMGRTDAAVRKLYSRAMARLTMLVGGPP